MHAFGLRRTAALVLAVALLVAAAPAAGAAPERAAGEPGIGPSLFRAVTAWLAALWPGAGPASAPAPAWEALGSELQQVLIAAVKWHSWEQWSAIHQADREAYKKFKDKGTEIITLPPEEVAKFRKAAIPLWYKWAKKDAHATKAFKIWIDFLLDTGFVKKEWVAGESL